MRVLSLRAIHLIRTPGMIWSLRFIRWKSRPEIGDEVVGICNGEWVVARGLVS